MINLMVGCNFDDKLLDGYITLNKIHDDVKIVEMFGSMRDDPIGCSREEDRLPEIDIVQLAKFVERGNENNIITNYTLNRSCIGSVEDFHENFESNFLKFIKFLEHIGVGRLTVTHPLLMEIISSEIVIPMEVSTIAHTYSINQIKYFKDFGADKICMNLMKNRDINFLKNYAAKCKELNITLELMANEACLFGCPYRYSHYNQQSHTKKLKKYHKNYPIGRCTVLHTTKKVEWLKARLIRPEDMKRYVDIGINNFKVTGRTHITDSQLRIVQYYMGQKLDGNFLDLFPQFYNIYKNQKEQKKAPFFIDNRDLDNFLDYWFDNLDFICTDHCEYDCFYCYEYLEGHHRG
jgi:collagenase-like PrtC family protease